MFLYILRNISCQILVFGFFNLEIDALESKTVQLLHSCIKCVKIWMHLQSCMFHNHKSMTFRITT